MLLRPPPILDDVQSQESYQYSQQSKQQSNRPKKGKKQSSLSMNRKQPLEEIEKKQYDNDSIHSNGSKTSKDKKTKQNSLGRPKIPNDPSSYHKYSDDDNKSVNSNGSKHSHKNTKKQSTIGLKPKFTNHFNPNLHQNQENNQSIKGKSVQNINQFSFKNAIYNEPEESIIKPYQKQFQESPPILRYQSQRQAKQQKNYKVKDILHLKNPTYSPFEQIQNKFQEEETPVVKLKQKSPQKLNKNAFNGIAGKKNESPVVQYDKQKEQNLIKNNNVNVFNSQTQIPISKIQQNNLQFVESNKLEQTKNKKRRQIFGNQKRQPGVQTESRVSGIEQSQSNGILGQTSLRRSKSKLKELFNQSKEKRLEVSNLENESRVGFTQNSSRVSSSNVKPSVGTINDRFCQIQKKILNSDQDNFDAGESSQSELNLSQSKNTNKQLNQKDSVFFHFQPEKKKGISLATQHLRNQNKIKTTNQPLDTFHNLNNINLASKSIQMPVLNQNNLISKELEKPKHKIKEKSFQEKQIQQNLKRNNQYIHNSGIIEIAQKKIETNNIFNLDEEEQIKIKNKNNFYSIQQNQEPWHQIVQQMKGNKLEIKSVQRNERQAKNQEKQNKEIQLSKQKQIQDKQRKIQQNQRLKVLKLEQEQLLRKQTEKQMLKEKKQQEQYLYRKKREQQKLNIEEEDRIRVERKKNQERQQRQQTKRKQMQLKLQKQKQQAIKQTFSRENAHLNNIPGNAFRHQQSDNSSQKSNSVKRKNSKDKKQNSLKIGKPHQVQIRNQSPRAQESYYEEPSEKQNQSQLKTIEKQSQKPMKLLSFSDEEENQYEKPKSKTDMNFYDYNNSQKSMKPPSSKPPLSKKSNGSNSKSKSKTKQNTIGINMNKITKSNEIKPMKKMTLMQRAMLKNQSNSDASNSQDSFRSKDGEKSDCESQQSVKSRDSKKSLKKESTLNINKQISKTFLSKPPTNRKTSSIDQHEEELQNIQKEKQLKQKLAQMNRKFSEERIIVTKDCTFIDERGRLVKQDLIIKGNQVYGKPTLQSTESEVFERMRRSREGRRSRSKSRESRKVQKRNSKDHFESESGSGYDSSSHVSNSNYYQNNNQSMYDRTFKQSPQKTDSKNNNDYQNKSYAPFNSNKNNNSNNLALREFIQPVKQVPVYRKQPNNSKTYQNQRVQQEFYEEDQSQSNSLYYQKEPKITLNEIFSKKKVEVVNSNASKLQKSRSKNSMHRTERSGSKR